MDLPKSTNISSLADESFTLSDQTGEIRIKINDHKSEKFIKINQCVKIYRAEVDSDDQNCLKLQQKTLVMPTRDIKLENAKPRIDSEKLSQAETSTLDDLKTSNSKTV